tara:strand:+ start:3177 stop:3497 length:321 start_codon:yes stop_codon:yes gene_type:complete
VSYECGGCGKRVKNYKSTEGSPRGHCNCPSTMMPNWFPAETTNKKTGMPQSVPTEIKSNDRAFDTGWAVVKEPQRGANRKVCKECGSDHWTNTAYCRDCRNEKWGW